MSSAIRLFQSADWPQLWEILEPVFRAGDTYAFSPDITEEAAKEVWITYPVRTYVVTDSSEQVVATYYIKQNQTGLGSHVCNCGYVVGEAARGKGIATQMCEHSQQIAIALGFLAMQFNFVVSTNEGAVRLWQKLGYEIVGRLPKAFQHRQLGFVDALVMYKWLTPQ